MHHLGAGTGAGVSETTPVGFFHHPIGLFLEHDQPIAMFGGGLLGLGIGEVVGIGRRPNRHIAGASDIDFFITDGNLGSRIADLQFGQRQILRRADDIVRSVKHPDIVWRIKRNCFFGIVRIEARNHRGHGGLDLGCYLGAIAGRWGLAATSNQTKRRSAGEGAQRN